MNNEFQDIQQRVLERIRKTPMHSRAYFIARVIAAAAVALAVLGLSAFVLSFILFSITESGEQFLLGFGGGGFTAFLLLFPWKTLALDTLLIVLLEWLLQGFRIGYRFSLVSLFLYAFGASAVLALLVNLTPLHPLLLEHADHGQLPLGGGLYEDIRESHRQLGIFRGTVTSVGADTVTIAHQDGDRDTDDGTWVVQLPADASAPKLGQRLYVYGTSTDGVIEAYGIGAFGSEW